MWAWSLGTIGMVVTGGMFGVGATCDCDGVTVGGATCCGEGVVLGGATGGSGGGLWTSFGLGGGIEETVLLNCSIALISGKDGYSRPERERERV